jgi:hypothetical protein
VGLAEKDANRSRGRGIRGQRGELLDHLDYRPVSDPLAVGEAASLDNGRLEGGERLRDEA